MPSARPIYKDDILRAMRNTLSNRSAARYLGISYSHYQKNAKIHKLDEKDPNSLSLWDAHRNKCGKGIPKFLNHTKRKYDLMEILEGRVNSSPFKPGTIKRRIIEECIIEEKCNMCGFNERRFFDKRIPLLMNFKDKNKRNYRLENLELLCYNCYFLFIENVFNQHEIKSIEDYTKGTTMHVDWEIDEHYDKIIQNIYEENQVNIVPEPFPQKVDGDGTEFITKY